MSILINRYTIEELFNVIAGATKAEQSVRCYK